MVSDEWWMIDLGHFRPVKDRIVPTDMVNGDWLLTNQGEVRAGLD